MPTFDVTCTGQLPWAAVTELGRRGLLRSKGAGSDAEAASERHVLRIEGAQCPNTAALIALRQVREVGGDCEGIDVAAVTS